MAEINDPDLLNQLNAGPPVRGEVSDPDLLSQLNAPQSALAAAGQDVGQLGLGAAEGALKAPGLVNPVESLMKGIEPAINKTLGTDFHYPTFEHTAKYLLGKINADPEQYPPQGLGQRAARGVGETLTTPTTYLGGAGLGAKVVQGGLGAVGSELAGSIPGVEGSRFELPARMLGAGAAAQLPRVGARALTWNPIPDTPRGARREQDIATLRANMTEPTAGQFTDKRWVKRAESSLGEAPLAGGAGQETYNRVADQFTHAAARRMGENDLLTPDTITRAQTRIGDDFERSTSRLRVYHDPRLGNDFTAIMHEAFDEGLPDSVLHRLNSQINQIRRGFVTGNFGPAARYGVMRGEVYHSMTKKGTPLSRLIDDPDPNLAYYGTRIRSALDDALERTATGRGTRSGLGMRGALDEFRTARRQWYNMLVLSRGAAAAGEGAARGQITPQKLRQLLTNTDDKKLQYAAGRGDLHDLANAGESILTPLPNSNSAERGFIHYVPMALGSAAGAYFSGDPVEGSLLGGLSGVAATGAFGRGLMAGPTQRFLKNQAMTRSLRRMGTKSEAAVRAAGTAGLVNRDANPYQP